MVEVYRKDLATSYTVDNSIDPETGEVRDLAWYLRRGYDTDSSVQGTDFGGGSTPAAKKDEPAFSETKGREIGQALYSFMPGEVLDEFASQWAKTVMQILQ